MIALFALQAHGQALRAVHLRLVHAQPKVAVASREARRHHLLRLDHLAKLGEVFHVPRELSGEHLAVVGTLGGERDGVLDVRRLSGGGVAGGEVVAGQLAALAEHGDPRGDLQGAVHEQPPLGQDERLERSEVAPSVGFLAAGEAMPAVPGDLGGRVGVGVPRIAHGELVRDEALPVAPARGGLIRGGVHLQVHGDVPGQRLGVAARVHQQAALVAAHVPIVAPHLSSARRGEVWQAPRARGGVRGARHDALRGGGGDGVAAATGAVPGGRRAPSARRLGLVATRPTGARLCILGRVGRDAGGAALADLLSASHVLDVNLPCACRLQVGSIEITTRGGLGASARSMWFPIEGSAA